MREMNNLLELSEQEREALNKYKKELSIIMEFEDIEDDEMKEAIQNFEKNLSLLEAFRDLENLDNSPKKLVNSYLMVESLLSSLNKFEKVNKEILTELQQSSKIKKKKLSQIEEKLQETKDEDNPLAEVKEKRLKRQQEYKKKLKRIEYEEEKVEELAERLSELGYLEENKIKQYHSRIKKNFFNKLENAIEKKKHELASRPTILFEKDVLNRYLDVMTSASRNKVEKGGFFHYETIKENERINFIYIKKFYENKNTVEQQMENHDSSSSYMRSKQVRNMLHEKGGEEKLIGTHCHPKKEGFGRTESSHLSSHSSDVGKHLDRSGNLHEDAYSTIEKEPYEIISCSHFEEPSDIRRTLLQAHRLRRSRGTKQWSYELLPVWICKEGKLLSNSEIETRYPSIFTYNSIMPMFSTFRPGIKSYWDILTHEDSNLFVENEELAKELANRLDDTRNTKGLIRVRLCVKSRYFRRLLSEETSPCNPKEII